MAAYKKTLKIVILGDSGYVTNIAREVWNEHVLLVWWRDMRIEEDECRGRSIPSPFVVTVGILASSVLSCNFSI